MKKLKESRYDVVLRDAISPSAVLLAKLPTLPLVYSLRFTTGNTYFDFSFETFNKKWDKFYSEVLSKSVHFPSSR